jgi:methionine biosynthesis protein MetW
MDTHELFVQMKYQKVAELIPENSKILDIGCNDGDIRFSLKNPIYFGVDADKDSINKLVRDKIKAKQADLNKNELPFKKEKFDFVLLLDILEHVVNPKKLLLDAKTRLNSRGKLIITLPNDYHILNKMRFVFNKHLTEDPFAPYGHLHYFPINSGEAFLRKNGFEIEKKIFLPPIKPKIIPQSIKNLLTNLSPQTFARDVLYVLSV